MSDYHVIDHHHDEEAGVYRVLLGLPYETQQPMVDERGEPVREHIPLIGPEGEQVHDVDGKPVVLHGPQKFETQTHYHSHTEVVFAADDERWKGKSPEQIAEEQRADVKEQLDERAREAKRADELRAQRIQLPGSGQAL